jgi:hypothetical protein
MAKNEPKHPGQLATDAEMCAFDKAMDAFYSTSEMSPLHHDNRCKMHAPDMTLTDAYRLTHGYKFRVSAA